MSIGAVSHAVTADPLVDRDRLADVFRDVGVDAVRLARIMAAVGLAQNLSALRALSAEGIQAGHMALHASNLQLARKAGR